MSDRQERVACPACGQRFKLDPETVPEGGAGNQARCRGCGGRFLVRREGDVLSAVPAPEPAPKPPAKVKAASSTRGAAPVSRKQRRKGRGGKARKEAPPPPATPRKEAPQKGPPLPGGG